MLSEPDGKKIRTHKYAIDHEGQLYPVTKIVSLATGVSVNEFSGGRHPGHANGRKLICGACETPYQETGF